MLDGKTIIVVAADQGLRRSVAFALEVEGYSTESYDTVQKAEASSGEALCKILDDEILKSETPRNCLRILDAGRYCWSMACRPLSHLRTTRP